MGYTTSYSRVGRRWHLTRGFRLSPRRFSIYRLRMRLLCFFKILKSLKSSYEQALESLKKGIMKRKRSNSSNNSSSRMEGRSIGGADYKLRSYGRSNSFYSEAIAECLEFIKRSSLSVDENSVDRR